MPTNSKKNNLKNFLEHPFVRTTELIISIITFVITILPQVFGLFDNIVIRYLLLVISACFFGLFIAPRFFQARIPIYENRLKFMKKYLRKFICSSKKSVRILNILFTWFEYLEDDIHDKIVDDKVKFEILLLMRKRKKNDTSYLELREKDENIHGNGLVIGLNTTLFRLFKFLVNLAKEEGVDSIERFQIKEYSFLPVMCAYIFDDSKLVFGPYIAKDCSQIPLFEFKKKENSSSCDISDAFNEIVDHFNILSNPSRRPSMEYIEYFSYFDGKKNCKIHELIKEHYELINTVLCDKDGKYYKYLVREDDHTFDDKYTLGKESLEGRFDAVIRDIKREVNKRYKKKGNIK